MKLKAIMLTLLFALVSTLSVNAYDFEVDGMYYNVLSLSDLTCEVTSGDNSYSGDVKIPTTVTYMGRTLSVMCIGNNAFKNSKITSIDIPNSVTSIGQYAFIGCDYLTSIEVPNSVTEINLYTFYYCSKLSSVTLPNSITSIGQFAFSRCNSLKTINIPNSVTTIDYGAFYKCI